MKIKISALKRFPKSKKYTFTKLPAQKAPDRFSSLEARNVADKAARKRFGKDWFDKETSKPAITGMSTKALTDMAAEGYATKATDKLFIRTIKKEMSSSRKKTATFIKGASSNVKASIRPKKFTPKFVVPKVQYQVSDILSKPAKPGKKGFDPIFRFPKQGGQTITGRSKIVPSKGLRKAKSKGAMKSYMTAQSKSDAAFTKITERFTARAKASPFKNRSISTTVKQTGTRAENLREKKATRDAFKAMGIDDRVESNFRTTYFTKRTKGGKKFADTFTEQVTDSQGRVKTGKKKRQTLLFDKLFKD